MTTRATLKPGFRFSDDQFNLFWTAWSRACKYQKWDALTTAQREEKRHEILQSLGFESLKHVDATQGFDNVLRRLERLAGTVHHRADEGQRRRLLVRIGELFSDLDAAGYPPHSIDTILKKRFKVIPGLQTIPTLETPELVNLLRTLSSRLATWKKRQPPAIQPDPPAPGMAVANAMPDDCTALADTLFAQPDRSAALAHSAF